MIIAALNRIRTLYNQGDSRTRMLKSNIVNLILLKGVSVIVTFMLIPVTINYVDTEIYGVWLTLAAVLQWVQILDLGLASGLKNKLTEALAVKDYTRARTLVSTTYFAMSAVFVPISIIFYIIVPLVSWGTLLNIDASYVPIIVDTLRLLSALICIQMIANVIVSVLAAFQRVALSQAFLVIGNILAFLLILILRHTIPASLPMLAIVLAGAPVLVTIIGSIILYNGSCHEVAPLWTSIDMKCINSLLSLGSKFFIINVQSIIVYQTTNILISHVSSPDMVTAYNIAYKYLSLTIIVYSNVTLSLWTAYTDAYAMGDRDWMISTRHKMNRLLMYSIFLCFAFAIIAQPIYTIWIGKEVIIPRAMTWYVAAYVASYCFMTLNGTFIIGTGKVFLETITVSTGAIVFIPAALFAARWLEQYGIIASLIAMNMIYGIIFYAQTNKLLGGTARGIWNK